MKRKIIITELALSYDINFKCSNCGQIIKAKCLRSKGLLTTFIDPTTPRTSSFGLYQSTTGVLGNPYQLNSGGDENWKAGDFCLDCSLESFKFEEQENEYFKQQIHKWIESNKGELVAEEL